MKAVIYLDVPEWQIGQDATVYFPDTMMKQCKCELLKEQEAELQKGRYYSDVFDIGYKAGKESIVRCKDCRYGQYCTDGETTYQCFKWNSGEFGVLHKQDWFCADGERKDGGEVE